jgi:hypothetical protein
MRINDLNLNLDKLVGRSISPLDKVPYPECTRENLIKGVYIDQRLSFFTTYEGKPNAPWMRGYNEPQCKFTTEYTVDYVVANNIIIHCETKEEDEYVRTILHNAGKKWSNDNSYLDYSDWVNFGQEKHCIMPSKGFCGNIDSLKSYAIAANSEKISAVWFIVDNLNLLTETKTNITMYTVSRQFIGEIYNNVCTTWQEKIKEYFELDKNLFKEEFTIDGTTLKNWIEVAKTDSVASYKLLVQKWPEFVSKEIDFNDPNTYDNLELFIKHGSESTSLIATMSIGELANVSLYLNKNYNWEIKVNSQGISCLVPTKK